MDEEMRVAIKAYDEFTNVLNQFAVGLQGVERTERTVAVATDQINRTVSLFVDSIQKTGPPAEQAVNSLAGLAAADQQAAQAAQVHGSSVTELDTILAQFTSALLAVERAESGMTTATEQTNRLVSAFSDNVQKTSTSTKKVNQDLDDNAKAQKKAAAAAQEHKDKIDGLLQGLGALGILAAVKQGIQGVTAAGSDLDKNLGILKGLTGQAADESQAFLMGLQGQQKGVTELSTGMLELGRAGYDAQQSMKALPDLAKFAQASFMDMDKSTASVSVVLKAFGKDVKDAREVTDVFTTAANRSALGFEDFQLALGMSAGVARIAGQDYRELIAELSVLRDAGLGASDAGTSIKSAWMALMNPTVEAKKVMSDLGISVYDSEGKMRSWADIVASTEKALKPLNEQSRNLALTTIFGSDGVRAMALSMGRGSEYIRALTEDLKGSQGATAALASEMSNTFTGAMQRAQADAERLKITLFNDLKGGMGGLLTALDTLIVGFTSLSGPMRAVVELLIGGAGLVAAIAAVATLAKTTLIPVLTGLSALFQTTAATAGTAGTALAALGGPVGIALMAVTALTAGILAYAGAQERARREEEQKQSTLLDLGTQYTDLRKVLDDTTKSEADHTSAAESQRKVIKQIGDMFPELVKRWDEHGNAVELDTEKLNRNTEAARRNAKTKSQDEYDSLLKDLKRLKDEKHSLENELAGAQNPMSNALKGLFAAGDPAVLGSGSDYFTKSADSIKQEIAGVDKQIDETQAKITRAWAMRYGAGDTSMYDDYLDPSKPWTGNGDKKDVNNEDARRKAIQDQMDLLRHLVAMDDQRVDTAQEQLDWLQRIRATYGTTYDLDEAIHKLEVDISRQPLQDQLAGFEKRRQLGELTARQEQEFYENLVKNAEQFHLTTQERQDYEVKAAMARKAADKEVQDLALEGFRYQSQMTDASTRAQLEALQVIRDGYAEGSKERQNLDLEVHRLEKQLAKEIHDQRLAEIEFDSITQRWTNDQKLRALKDYLATAHDLAIEETRQLQSQIAQMEQQAERDHEQNLLGLYQQGLESQRKIREKALRDQQQAEEKDKQKQIDDERSRYEALLDPLRKQLETLQQQSQEIERQNRLLDLQNSLKDKDAEIAAVKSRRDRVVIESGGVLGFTLRRTYDEAKVAELEKERSQIAKNLADEEAKQARDRQQEALQAQISALEKERDARINTLNQELAALRQNHSDQMTAFNTFWDDMLSTQKVKQALEKTGYQTHYDDVLKITNQWVTDMNTAYAKIQAPTLQTGAGLNAKLGGAVLPSAGIAPATAAAPAASAAPMTVEVNNYGDHHYDGVAGVTEAVGAMVSGAKSALKPI